MHNLYRSVFKANKDCLWSCILQTLGNQWLNEHLNCPLCQRELNFDSCVPDPVLRSIVEMFVNTTYNDEQKREWRALEETRERSRKQGVPRSQSLSSSRKSDEVTDDASTSGLETWNFYMFLKLFVS